MKIHEAHGQRWTEPETAEDARREDVLAVIEYALDWQEGASRIAWDEVWDRADGVPLDDGTRLTLPTDLDAPPYRAWRAHGRRYLSDG